MSRLLAGLVLILVGCSSVTRETRRGQQLYDAGQYRESNQAFQRALRRERRPCPAVRGWGHRLSHAPVRGGGAEFSGGYQRTLGSGSAASTISVTPTFGLLKRRLKRRRPCGQAIGAFEEALRLNPADSAAKWNLELALQRRGEDRESGGSPGRGRSADYGRGSSRCPGYEGNPEAAVGAMAGGGFGSGEGESAEELSETQARQLLEAVEREELNSHQGKARMGARRRRKGLVSEAPRPE